MSKTPELVRVLSNSLISKRSFAFTSLLPRSVLSMTVLEYQLLSKIAILSWVGVLVQNLHMNGRDLSPSSGWAMT